MIRSKIPPVVEITGECSAAYVWFNRRSKFARTISLGTWPVLNIDLDETDAVIGIEAIGYKKFSIKRLLAEAGVEAPPGLIRRTRYVHTTESTRLARA